MLFEVILRISDRKLSFMSVQCGQLRGGFQFQISLLFKRLERYIEIRCYSAQIDPPQVVEYPVEFCRSDLQVKTRKNRPDRSSSSSVAPTEMVPAKAEG